MARNFNSYADAVTAAYLYIEDSIPVSEITSRYSVNTYRLYEVLDNISFHGAIHEAAQLLKAKNPIAFERMENSITVRRTAFGKPLPNLPLFG